METLNILNVVISQIHNLCQVLCDSRCRCSVTLVPKCCLLPSLLQNSILSLASVLSPHPSLFYHFFPSNAAHEHCGGTRALMGFGELHRFRVETWSGACGFRGKAVQRMTVLVGRPLTIRPIPLSKPVDCMTALQKPTETQLPGHASDHLELRLSL